MSQALIKRTSFNEKHIGMQKDVNAQDNKSKKISNRKKLNIFFKKKKY